MKFLDFPERQSRGDLDFPYMFYHITRRHPNYAMPCHWHPLYEIIHVFTGSFRLQLEDCQLLLLPGDSAFVSSGVTHGGTPEETKDCCYECMLLDLDSIFRSVSPATFQEPWISDLLNQKLLIHNYFPSECYIINNTITDMLDLLRFKPDAYPLLLRGFTYLLLGRLFQFHFYSHASPLHTQKAMQLKDVLSFIDNHYKEDIQLCDLAACANMNKNYFCRYFRELTHRTPMDYLNYYRIEAACQLLSYTNKTITEIAFDCGFHDAGYFAKVFKRYKNQTPSEYIRFDFRAASIGKIQ